MFLISKDEGLTVAALGKILNDFRTEELPKLQKYWNYYDGKHQILNKKYSDENKPNSKVIINYCYNIVQQYLGYIAGIPIQYSNDDFQEVLDCLKYNDVADEDAELLRQALIFGRAFEINYIDEEAMQRFKVLSPLETIPIYWNNLNNDLAYVVRFYSLNLVDQTEEAYQVEVYGAEGTMIYKSDSNFSTFNLIEQQPNFYDQVPVTVFSLNTDERSIFDQVMSLNDAYEETFSNSVDSESEWADAYLCITGAIADKDDIENMKKNRVLMLDPDSSASYLTKSVTDTAVQDILKTTNDHIHHISCAPDFNDEKFGGVNSGVSLRYRLVAFENVSAAIESAMRKALQKRIELICSILSLTGDGEETWRDVSITFTRNLPISLDPSSPQELMYYKGLVSDYTLLEQIPFVEDVDEEMNRLAEQQKSTMDLYRFGNEEDDDETTVLADERDKDKREDS